MSHRIDSPERIRRAHSDRLDSEKSDAAWQHRQRVDAAAARTAQRDEYERSRAAEAATVDPREAITPAQLGARLARSRLVPRALTIACAEHEAAEGEPCFRTATGVCGPRLRAAGLLREGADPLSPPDWMRAEGARIEPRVQLQYGLTQRTPRTAGPRP